MQRTNIHLSDGQRLALKRLSRRTGLSAAELVRRAIDAFVQANISKQPKQSTAA